MSYDRARDLPTYRLDIEDRPGLVMRARRPSFAGERAVRKAWPVLADRDAGREEQETALALAAGALAGALVGWTLTMDGVRVPCTLHGLIELDTPFLLELVTAWVEQVALRPFELDTEPDDTGGEDGDAPDDAAEPGTSALDEEWLSQLPMVAMPAPTPEDVTAEEDQETALAFVADVPEAVTAGA